MSSTTPRCPYCVRNMDAFANIDDVRFVISVAVMGAPSVDRWSASTHSQICSALSSSRSDSLAAASVAAPLVSAKTSVPPFSSLIADLLPIPTFVRLASLEITGVGSAFRNAPP